MHVPKTDHKSDVIVPLCTHLIPILQKTHFFAHLFP
jgi:hypothetical protein